MMDNLYKHTQLTVVILGVLTPCLLLAGYVYYLGHITTFGLDSSLMSRGFGDVITESWYIGVLLLTYFLDKWWRLLAFVVIMIAILVGVFIYIVRLKARGVELFANPITKEKQGRSVLRLTQWHWMCCGEMVMGAGSLICIPAVVLLIAATVVIFPFQKGNQDALKEIDNFRKNGCEVVAVEARSFSRCVHLIDISSSNATMVAHGLLVTANSERIAIFTELAIEVWPMLDRYKLQKSYLPRL